MGDVVRLPGRTATVEAREQIREAVIDLLGIVAADLERPDGCRALSDADAARFVREAAGHISRRTFA